MKRSLSILLLFAFFVLAFTGCENKDQKSNETNLTRSWSVDFTSQDAAVPTPLSEEDADILETLLLSDAWIDDLAKCESDVLLESSGGDRYDYHSECGTFNDRKNQCSLTLSDEDKTICNELLRKYGRLAIDDLNDYADLLLTEPPVLTVRSSDGSSIEALRGTTSWMYDREDGTQTGFEADSVHPLDCKDFMPTLTLIPMIYSSKHPLEMFLCFDVAPDSVAIHCWSDENWDDPSTESRPVDLYSDILEGGYRFVGYNGGYIYEVVAEWNSYERFEGEAYYSFYAVPFTMQNSEVNVNDPVSSDALKIANENSDTPYKLAMSEAELDGAEELARQPIWGGDFFENEDVRYTLSGYPDVLDAYHVVHIELLSNRYHIFGYTIGDSFQEAKEHLASIGFKAAEHTDTGVEMVLDGVTVRIRAGDDIIQELDIRAAVTNRKDVDF